VRQDRAAIALIRRGSRYFLQRRAFDSGHLPGLWEFPGGKLEPGESPEQALLRELAEEIGVRPEWLRALPEQHHCYPDRQVSLHPFLCAIAAEPSTALAWGWFLPAEMAGLPMPVANQGLIAGLE
jgi:mutator protein MutT